MPFVAFFPAKATDEAFESPGLPIFAFQRFARDINNAEFQPVLIDHAVDSLIAGFPSDFDLLRRVGLP